MANKIQKSVVRLAPHPQLVEDLKKQLLIFGSLKIANFGIFKLKRMKAINNGFDPYKRIKASYPAYTKITFTPTASLKTNIQTWK